MGVWAPRSGQKNDSKSINQSINQEIVNFCSIKKILKLLRDNIVLLIRCEKLRNPIRNEHVRLSRARARAYFKMNFAREMPDFARNPLFSIFLFK